MNCLRQRLTVTRVASLVSILVVLLLPAAAGCAGEETTTSTQAATTKKPSGTPDSTSAAISDHAVKISEFVCPYTVEGEALTPGMITAFLLVEIENTAEADYAAGPDDFTLETESGESYSAVTGYNVANAINDEIVIAPGASATGVLFFDIPDDIRVVYLVDDSSAETLKIELPRPAA
ncbi:MAG: DUF4352 domain-containing protein [Thermoleophilia bacterium]